MGMAYSMNVREERNTFTILDGNAAGKRPFVRPSSSKKVNTKYILEEWSKRVKWIDVLHDRDQ